MEDKIVDNIRKNLLHVKFESDILEIKDFFEKYCSDFLEENKPNNALPGGTFNLFAEILSKSELYNKSGMAEFIDFLYFNYFERNEKDQLLRIVSCNFNDYPDYCADNNSRDFICVILMMICFMYDEMNQYDQYLDFMSKLYLISTQPKKEFIELYLVEDDFIEVNKKIKLIQQ